MTFLKSMAVLLTVLCSASFFVRQTPPPAVWQSINADGLFKFRLPQGFIKAEKTEAENHLGEYYKGGAKILFV